MGGKDCGGSEAVYEMTVCVAASENCILAQLWHMECSQEAMAEVVAALELSPNESWPPFFAKSPRKRDSVTLVGCTFQSFTITLVGSFPKAHSQSLFQLVSFSGILQTKTKWKQTKKPPKPTPCTVFLFYVCLYQNSILSCIIEK